MEQHDDSTCGGSSEAAKTELPVYTAGDLCKKCYSCVRSCPTKAIEVHGGQADIIVEKCIACGACVVMCSQEAKRVRSAVQPVGRLLGSSSRVYAMLAPSFPAAFLDVPPDRLVGALRECGFAGVYEVAFGADLVSYAYYRLFYDHQGAKKAGGIPGPFISSPCPAVVSYVEKIHPELVPYLAPVMSPMEAMAQVIRTTIDSEGAIVFIGPCVAKKEEATRLGLVNEVMTYGEAQELIEARGVDLSSAPSRDFDPPQANLGKIYPVTGGLLKAAAIDADLVESPVAVVEGSSRITEILQVLSKQTRADDAIETRLFDLLFCEGCIAGPTMPYDLSFYERKKYIVEYMKRKPLVYDIDEWAAQHREYLDMDLSKSFTPMKRHEETAPEEEIRKILAKTGKYTEADELNCRACGYPSCRDKAIAVYKGVAEVEMCLPFLITKLERTLEEFEENQSRLVQAEKLASMGQMAAGIAHEINNPLGVILMYAHLLKDGLEGDDETSSDAARIVHEAERTRQIVRGILDFAREKKLTRAATDVNALLRDAANDAATLGHGSEVAIELDLDDSMRTHMVDANQLRQVFDNILKNAVEAVDGSGTISIVSKREPDGFRIRISDTGPGIPDEHLSKLFSPFFTTKPLGKGTGLGLPVCYGIVKMHEGTIQAGNNEDGGAFFEIKVKDVGNAESVA
jgi:iron only hydrogenase large subunit-like protein/nitrogen-specific signal transduction histidine kinase